MKRHLTSRERIVLFSTILTLKRKRSFLKSVNHHREGIYTSPELKLLGCVSLLKFKSEKGYFVSLQNPKTVH